MPVLERPLTVIERVLHAVARHLDGDGMPVFAVRCSGPWEEPRFRAALTAVQACHPLMRCRIVEPRPHWPIFQLDSSAPPIPLDVAPAASNLDWEAISLRHAQTKFDPASAPLIRITALPHAGDRTFDLVISCHHALADAKSVLAILRELFTHMSGQPFDSRVREEEMIFRPMKRASSWYVARQAIKLISMQIRQLFSRQVLVPDEVPFPGACLRTVCTPATTSALVQACRQQQTTVYGALAAATLHTLAQREAWKNVSIQMMVPFDIRDGYVAPVDDQTVGCFAGILDFWQTSPLQTEFWELARQCRGDVLHERRWWMPNCWDHLMSRVAFTPAWLKALRRMAVGVNNLGLCPEVSIGSFRLEELSWFSRTQNLGGSVTVNAATINGGLNITVQGSRLTRQTLTEIRDALLQTLETAAGVSPQAKSRRAA